MKRTWLSERVVDLENASKRFEASTPKPGCETFLKAFEKQLHHQLHLKNFVPNGMILLPIQKGCFSAAQELMEANGVRCSKMTTYIANECECVNLVLVENKLHMTPSVIRDCDIKLN